MARKTGQIVGRGRQRWLVRVFLGRDRETRRRRYHSRIVRGPVRHAQTPLDIQAVYQQLVERGLSARTVRYTHSVLRSAMRRRFDGGYCPRILQRALNCHD